MIAHSSTYDANFVLFANDTTVHICADSIYITHKSMQEFCTIKLQVLIKKVEHKRIYPA